MEKSPRRALLPLIPILGLYGCDLTPPDETIVSSGGLVNKGILAQAIATAYKAGTKEVVKRVYTELDGTFSLDDVNFEGTLYIDVRTTSQTLATCDSADGCGAFPGGLKLAGESDANLNGVIDFGDKYFYNDSEFVLTAYIIPSAEGLKRFAVTPLTHMAAEAVKATGNVDPENVQIVNAQIAELLGLDGTDITRVIPPDITNQDNMLAATPAQRLYAALNAAVASSASASTSVAKVINELASSFVRDGGLVANSTDSSKITLASLQQKAKDVAVVVSQKLVGVDMTVVETQIDQEIAEQLSKTPDVVVKPSAKPSTKPDFDKDGISDADETKLGTDPYDSDSDDDGLNDGAEVALGTKPLNADTDGDGMTDGWEVAFNLDPLSASDATLDADGDGLSNLKEFNAGTSPINTDTDGDGLTDGEEVNTYNTNPLSIDSDGDGLSDGDEVNEHQTDPNNADSDGDGMGDGWEIGFSLDPNDSADAVIDSDGDGLVNVLEHNLSLNPKSNDTDGNGVLDGNEDFDGDGVGNYEETTYGLNPAVDDANTDTDGDTITIIDEFRNGSDPQVANPFIELVSDAQVYTNSSTGNLKFAVSTDESLVVTSQYDVSDLGIGSLDTNGYMDIVIHDLSSNTYEIPVRDAISPPNLLNDGGSSFLDLSKDNTKILFSSYASTAVTGDGDGNEDLFVYDRVSKQTKRLGNNSIINSNSYYGKFRADGEKVLMESYSSIFVSPDSNGYGDVFTYDLMNDQIDLVSQYYLGGDSANQQSNVGSISADGNRLVFASRASNIVDAGVTDTDSLIDTYFLELPNTYRKVTNYKDSAEDGNLYDAGYASISANGKAIVYQTPRDVLDLNVSGSSATYNQIFYVDVDLMLSGATVEQYTKLVSSSYNGSNNGYANGHCDGSTLQVSPDGQYVYYKSSATNIVATGNNAASIDDIYVWDRNSNTTRRVSQFVYGMNGSALKYDSNPSVNHTNGMGVVDFKLNHDGSVIYAMLDHGHEYTDATAACTPVASYCMYKIKLFLNQTDQDLDGLNDRAEAASLTLPSVADTDNDGLKDGDEVYQHKTSPIKVDTDGDGVNDGTEITNGTDPLNPSSF